MNTLNVRKLVLKDDDCTPLKERFCNSPDTLDDIHSSDRRSKNDWLSASNDGKTSVAELVREAAEETKVFSDPQSKNYYKYDETKKSYEFYASLKSEENSCKRRKSKKKREANKNNEIGENDSHEEEGEIDSSSSSDVSVIEISDEETVKQIDYSCVRMIVESSSTLDEGSLLLITCKGAKIGNDDKCEVYITDNCVSKLHAEVTFDEKESVYYITDVNSEEGSFICESRLNANESYALKHGDIVRFGDCELLIHIHSGRDVTCIHCEPGCVQASLKSLQNRFNNVEAAVDINYRRRKQLNAIKKKYGINTFEERRVCLPEEYEDLAELRRQTVGSDNPYEKTEEGTSHEKPLTDKNKGFKMMKKMGWVQGHGLGKAQSGRLSP
ncbi:Angiogenic factor with G patch and FHA domains 1-like protein, partial [Leptotrombidium deliense]